MSLSGEVEMRCEADCSWKSAVVALEQKRDSLIEAAGRDADVCEYVGTSRLVSIGSTCTAPCAIRDFVNARGIDTFRDQVKLTLQNVRG